MHTLSPVASCHEARLPCFKQLAYKQALWGALAVGWRKEGKVATTSLEFDYLHRKSQCEMPIGGDNISNDIITLGLCFSMFAYFCTCFHFVLIGGNLTAELTGSHRKNWRWNSNSGDVVARSTSFFHLATRASPESLHTGYKVAGPCSLWHIPKPMIILFSFVKHVFKFYSWNFL